MECWGKLVKLTSSASRILMESVRIPKYFCQKTIFLVYFVVKTTCCVRKFHVKVKKHKIQVKKCKLLPEKYSSELMFSLAYRIFLALLYR